MTSLPEVVFRPLTTATKRIAICCRDCGSEDVARDAWASWDKENQCWELSQVFDYAFCNACETDTKLIEKDIE